MCMIQSINTKEISLALDKIESFVYNDDDDSNNYSIIAKTKKNKTKKKAVGGEDTLNA